MYRQEFKDRVYNHFQANIDSGKAPKRSEVEAFLALPTCDAPLVPWDAIKNIVWTKIQQNKKAAKKSMKA